jgi:hypothetical protein
MAIAKTERGLSHPEAMPNTPLCPMAGSRLQSIVLDCIALVKVLCGECIAG